MTDRSFYGSDFLIENDFVAMATEPAIGNEKQGGSSR